MNDCPPSPDTSVTQPSSRNIATKPRQTAQGDLSVSIAPTRTRFPISKLVVDGVRKDLNALHIETSAPRPSPIREQDLFLYRQPYPNTSIPSLLPETSQSLLPWVALPTLFSGSELEPPLSLVRQKPEIANVVIGRCADPFTSRE